MFAASCLKFPTQNLGLTRSEFGPAPSIKLEMAGSRQTGVEDPLQAVFLVGAQREAYLSGEPAGDDRFVDAFAHELEHSGGYTTEAATAVAGTLLPDILYYDPSKPARYPDNGRTLTDDVVDVFLSIYANRKITDKVGPHRDLLGEFPYLGPPHEFTADAIEKNL